MSDDVTLKVTKRTRPVEPVPEHLAENSPDFLLHVDDTVVIGIREYCGRDVRGEFGGILLGLHRQSGDKHLVEIRDFRPLASNDSGRLHFTFDEGALLAAWQNLPKGLERIGWFHSHPKLGDPFMSLDDKRLHQGYFPAPWHVSCVVATGEWALPLGFWRLVDAELVRIKSYWLRMTDTDAVGEQDRRYLDASVGGQLFIEGAISQLKAALDEIAMDKTLPETSVLEDIMKLDLPAAGRLVSTIGLGSLIRLGTTISSRLDRDAEIENLAIELNRYRELGVAKHVIKSEYLAGRLIVSRRNCLTLNAQTTNLCLGSFDENVVLPLSIRHPEPILCGALTGDETLCILMGDGAVFSVERAFERISLLAQTSNVHFHLRGHISVDLLPTEMAIRGRDLYMLHAGGISRAELHKSSNEFNLSLKNCIIFEGAELQDIHLLGGVFSNFGCAVARRGNELVLIGFDGEIRARTKLRLSLADLPLREACAVSTGIGLLFDDEKQSKIEIVGGESLESKLHFRTSANSNWQRVDRITSDDRGALFARAADAVVQIT